MRSALLLLLLGAAIYVGTSIKEQPRTDRYGDPLPPGAVARIGTSRLRSNWETRSLAFSPDGKVLVVGDDDHLRFWDVVSGKEIRHFNGGIGQVNVLLFSPDGKYLAGGGGGGMGLWEVSTGNRLPHLKGQFGHTNALAFSPDGTALVSGGYGNTIHVWEIASGREIRKLFPPGSHTEREATVGSIRGVVEHVQFSPSGRTLFSRSFDRDQGLTVLQAWDMTTGKERGKAKRYSEKALSGVLYSPDSRLALIQSHDRVTALNLDSGEVSPLPLERPQVFWSRPRRVKKSAVSTKRAKFRCFLRMAGSWSRLGRVGPSIFGT